MVHLNGFQRELRAYAFFVLEEVFTNLKAVLSLRELGKITYVNHDYNIRTTEGKVVEFSNYVSRLRNNPKKNKGKSY